MISCNTEKKKEISLKSTKRVPIQIKKKTKNKTKQQQQQKLLE